MSQMMGSPSFNNPGLNSFLGSGGDPFGQYLQGMMQMNPGGQPSYEALRNEATNQGYTVKGNQAVRYPYGSGTMWGRSIPSTMGLGNFAGATQQANPLSGMPPLLMSALIGDTNRMQSAANEQYARNNQQIAGIDQFLGGMGPQMMGQANQLAGGLQGLAGQAMGMGQEQAQAMQQFGQGQMGTMDQMLGQYNQNLDQQGQAINQTMGQQMPQYYNNIEQGMQRADQGVQQFQQGISEYSRKTLEDVSAAADGMRQNAQSQMQMARSGVLPDGTVMTPAQQMDVMNQVRMNTNMEVQQAVIPMMSKFNENMVGLKQALGQMTQNAGAMRLQGAQLRGQGVQMELGAQEQLGRIEDRRLAGEQARQAVGSQVANQMLQSQQLEQNMMELASGLNQAAATMQQAAMFQAVNLEMQGRMGMAQLVQQNPQSVVSWFQGLLAMYSARAASTGNTRLT